MSIEKNIFGTDGIRRRVGIYPLNANGIQDLVRALVNVMNFKFFSVVIGCDTRISCTDIKTCLISELRKYHIYVYFVGVAPTPVISFLTRVNKVDFGIMITASHNSADYNGLKIFYDSGEKLCIDDECKISHFLSSCLDEVLYDILNPKNVRAQEDYGDVVVNLEQYYSYVIENFKNKIKLPHDFSIAIDYANGANTLLFGKIIRAFIKDEYIFEFNNVPNGYNINEKSGSVNSEFIQKKTLEYNAKLGVAFDGDGDRISICHQDGNIVNGNVLLATVFVYQNQKYGEKNFVSTILANGNLDKFLADRGASLFRTNVGDRNIFNMMKQEGCFTGGETSGHIIVPESQGTSDSIIACLKVLEIISNALDKDHWFVNFENIPFRSINIEYQNSADMIINHDIFINMMQKLHDSLLGNGRLIVRKSGTESIIRFYGESNSIELLDDIMDEIIHSVEYINSLNKQIS